MIEGSPDLSGEILEDRYRLLRRLGTEWFGDIYEAEQLRLGRTVSIKILATDANTPELLGRFLREAQALARLQHPGIVFVIDFGVHRGRPFLVRDVVNGESLEKRLERVGRYLPEDAAPLLIAICEALEHAHAAGVIHRHLTPSSVLFDENDRVRIGNFGLVRLLEQAGGDALTAPGTIVGWSPYTAPEQAKGGGEVDGRVDLYALGVIAHQMISGKLPQYENSIHESIALPKEANALAAAIDRLRARSADARFPSAAWALNVLRAAAGEVALPDASAEINTNYSNAGKISSPPPPLPKFAPPPAPPPTPATVAIPQLKMEAAVEHSNSSLSSFPSLPSISLPPEPSPALSQDIPGFFDAPAAPPDESSLSFTDVGKENRKSTAHPTFAKQFWHAVPTLMILVLITGGAFAFWYFVIGLPNPVADARGLVRAGKISGVIQQLADHLDKNTDDAEMHAALGYAYVYGGSPAKALDQYGKAIEKNVNVLERADIAALVGLLAIRGENSLVAQKMLERIGQPALTYLHTTADDPALDPYLRCRTADAMQSLGERTDVAKSCAGAGEGKSAGQKDLIARRMTALGIHR